MFLSSQLLIKSDADINRLVDRIRDLSIGIHNCKSLYEGSLWHEVELDQQLSSAEAYDLAHQLQALPEIEKIDVLLDSEIKSEHFDDEESNQKTTVSVESVSPNYRWHLEHTRAEQAWALTASKGSGVLIGHLDTGYTEHPENFSGGCIRTELGFNFVENTQDAIEPLSTIDHGHGGATSSLVISPDGRQSGFGGDDPLAYASGIATDAELIPIRVDNNVMWVISKAEDVKGIHHAMANCCDIISMSRGGFHYDALFEEVEKAFYEGIIIVAAAGNYVNNVVYPARYAYVTAVSGTTIEKKPWDGASRGESVNISAPASGVFRARTRKKSRDYFYDVAPSSGTSYATPIVASAAALWLSHHGGRQTLIIVLGGEKHAVPLVFNYLLKNHAYSAGVDWDANLFGPGIIDIEALIKAELPSLDVVNDLLEEFANRNFVDLNPADQDIDKEFDRLLKAQDQMLDLDTRELLYNEFRLNSEFFHADPKIGVSTNGVNSQQLKMGHFSDEGGHTVSSKLTRFLAKNGI